SISLGRQQTALPVHHRISAEWTMQLEMFGLYMVLLGLCLAVIAWIWLVVAGFFVRVLWGLALLGFPPFLLFFSFVHWSRGKKPFFILLLAGAVASVPFGVNWYQQHYVSLGPREKIVDGERHITLTGWNEADYSILRQKPDTVVLQMANSDVDD